MAPTFNWTIPTTEYNKADGGVFVAHYRVTAEETVGEDTYTASAYGTCGFTPDPSSPDFMPYDSLTESEVLGWVWGSIDKDETEARLADDIAGQKAPVTEAGVPWV